MTRDLGVIVGKYPYFPLCIYVLSSQRHFNPVPSVTCVNNQIHAYYQRTRDTYIHSCLFTSVCVFVYFMDAFCVVIIWAHIFLQTIF